MPDREVPPAPASHGGLFRKTTTRLFGADSSTSSISLRGPAVSPPAAEQDDALTTVKSNSSFVPPPPPFKQRKRRESSITSLSEIRHFHRRSNSSTITASQTPLQSKTTPEATSKLATSPQKHRQHAPYHNALNPSRQKSSESVNRSDGRNTRPSSSAGDDGNALTSSSSTKSKSSMSRLGRVLKRDDSGVSTSTTPIDEPVPPMRSTSSHSSSNPHPSFGLDAFNPNFSQIAATTVMGASYMQASQSNFTSSSSTNLISQHISDTAAKRISTLDYLRKTHEGRVYWFNTLNVSRSTLAKLPSFEPQRMARRATQHLLLGLSLPAILDPNSATAVDYLRAFNALLAEFEAYQAAHPVDGSTPTGGARARIPQMFKRSQHPPRPSGNSKDALGGSLRRGASSQHTGDNNPSGLSPSDGGEPRSAGSSHSAPHAFSPTSIPSGTTDAGEDYTFLLTPSLPFDPDPVETFSTLCDVLIDTYTKITILVGGDGGASNPNAGGPAAAHGSSGHAGHGGGGGTSTGGGANASVGELFAKADARVRRAVVQGYIKELEELCRGGSGKDDSVGGVREELAGVGKVVLGGLM